MFLDIVFYVATAAGLLIMLFGCYEEFYQHKKRTLILGSVIMMASIIYFGIKSYNKGLVDEYMGAMVLVVFFIALIVITIFKKEK